MSSPNVTSRNTGMWPAFSIVRPAYVGGIGSRMNSSVATTTNNATRMSSRWDTRRQYTGPMNIRLTAIEARIIGSLIEKQITTPDQYPLSLNALVNACNQKSNREPPMQLDEPTVKFVVDGLARRHMVVEKSG